MRTIALFVIDGITAVTPNCFGMIVSAGAFFGVNHFDKKREITFEVKEFLSMEWKKSFRMVKMQNERLFRWSFLI